jgi:hypothetical protein
MFRLFRIFRYIRRLRTQIEKLKHQIIGGDFPVSEERWSSWYHDTSENHQRTNTGDISFYPAKGISNHPGYQQLIEVHGELGKIEYRLFKLLRRKNVLYRLVLRTAQRVIYERPVSSFLTYFLYCHLFDSGQDTYWMSQARRHLDEARDSSLVRERLCSVEDAAVLALADQACSEVLKVESPSDSTAEEMVQLAFYMIDWNTMAKYWVYRCRTNARFGTA